MEKLISQLKTLPQWQRLLILVAIPIASIVYAWSMLISPVKEEINNTKAEIEKVKTEINNIKASLNPSIIENLKKEEAALRAELSLKEEELKRLVGELPEEGEISTLLRNIGQVAQKSGLSILNMQVSPPQQATYVLVEEIDRKREDVKRKVVKEAQQEPQQQQQQQQQKNTQQAQQAAPLQSASFMRSELKLTLLGSYGSIKNFIGNLKKEGVISYPASMSLTPQGDKIRVEIIIYLLMKAKGGET